MITQEIIKKYLCSECEKGIKHYHEKTQMLDFWQPIGLDKVCWCGKTWAHNHYKITKILIPARQNKESISND